MKKSFALCGAAIAVTGFVTAAQAATVDFESVPGVGAPFETLVITNQFAATAGVTFSLLDDNGDPFAGGPILAQVGDTGTGNDGIAFAGAGGIDDGIATGSQAQVGQFFLTDDGLQFGGLSTPTLVATYSEASSFFSADILDIDNSETFEVRIFDAVVGGNQIGTININTATENTGNGIATTVSFTSMSENIRRIEFAGSVNRTGSFFGLGFDNFQTGVTIDPIPVPASLPLLAGALGLLGWVRRRKS